MDKPYRTHLFLLTAGNDKLVLSEKMIADCVNGGSCNGGGYIDELLDAIIDLGVVCDANDYTNIGNQFLHETSFLQTHE